MVCKTPESMGGVGNDVAFTFGIEGDPMMRGVEMVNALWSAPWRAFWTIALECCDVDNYR